MLQPPHYARPRTRVTSQVVAPKNPVTQATCSEELPGPVEGELGANETSGREKFSSSPTSPRAVPRLLLRRGLDNPLLLDDTVERDQSGFMNGQVTMSSSGRGGNEVGTFEAELRNLVQGLDDKLDHISGQVGTCLDGLTKAALLRPTMARKLFRGGRSAVRRVSSPTMRNRENANYHLDHLFTGSASQDIAQLSAQDHFSSSQLQSNMASDKMHRVSFTALSPRTLEGLSGVNFSQQGSDGNDGTEGDTYESMVERLDRRNQFGHYSQRSSSDVSLEPRSTRSRQQSPFAVGFRSVLSENEAQGRRRGFFFATLSQKPSDHLAAGSSGAHSAHSLVSPRHSGSSSAPAEPTRRRMQQKMDRMAKVDAFFSNRQKRSEAAEWVYALIDDPESSRLAWGYSVCLRILVLMSVALSWIQTFRPPPIDELPAAISEISIDSLFLIDVLMRFVTCPSPCHFFHSFYNCIDVLSVAALPIRIYKEVKAVGRDSAAFYILFCLVPVLRLLKSLRGFQTFKLLLSAFKRTLEALPVLLFTLLTIVMTFSALIYMVEPRSNIDSLPDSMYFTVVTITTVGYGDVAPASPEGKVLVCGLVIIGVLYMAMPIGIIGSAFNEVWNGRDKILLMQRVRDRMDLWGYKPADIPILFNLFDKDTDGELTLEDFRMMIKEMKLGLSEERIVQLFQSFDIDASGTIDAPEFIRHLFPSAYHELFEVDDQSSTPDLGRSALTSVAELVRRASSGVTGVPSSQIGSASGSVTQSQQIQSIQSQPPEVRVTDTSVPERAASRHMRNLAGGAGVHRMGPVLEGMWPPQSPSASSDQGHEDLLALGRVGSPGSPVLPVSIDRGDHVGPRLSSPDSAGASASIPMLPPEFDNMRSTKVDREAMAVADQAVASACATRPFPTVSGV